MASEKSRYLNRNRRPESPFSTKEILASTASMPHERLIEIVELRADWDEILREILCMSLAIRTKDIAIAKAAIDNVMSISEPIRYDESGHGQIIFEIERELKEAAANGGRPEYLTEIGRYAVDRAQTVAEMFEDDWDWTSSIESLEKFVNSAVESGDGPFPK